MQNYLADGSGYACSIDGSAQTRPQLTIGKCHRLDAAGLLQHHQR
jgi:hypothetical protein